VDWNQEAVNRAAAAVRIISAEAVEKAKSGHPGMPMGMADAALVLWARHLRFNPAHPAWPDRDRFILSAGHGSMLLYMLLHLFGFGLTMEDIRDFRQWGSKTPGHPEHGITPGVETTTGPLGQGFANGVGMALAAKIMAARVNTPKFPVLSHRVTAIVSDGDIMEGVASEAASLAGHLGLGNIVYLYDDNDITIEGARGLSFSEDTARRFEAYGWHVQKADGLDRAAMDQAIANAYQETSRPSIIIARTTIGFGCPTKAGTADTHGAPVGPDEIAGARQCLHWDLPEFTVPAEAYAFCHDAVKPKLDAFEQWERMLQAFSKEEPERAKIFEAMQKGDLPRDLEQKVMAALDVKPVATRRASGAVLQALAKELPLLIGGSADLAPSNNTMIKGAKSISKQDFSGRNLHFGIREHGMAGLMNGMALYGLVPYGGTFLVFSDYMRPSIRLAALMGLRVIYVFTHDSIFVGEDGPTHQPVEQVAALRVIPNLHVIRPADAAETAMAWMQAVARKDGPTALILSRQTLPAIDRAKYGPASGLDQGAYTLGGDVAPDLLIMASGSEVGVAIEVFEELRAAGVKARVISMPCFEKFEAQDKDYREEVLPSSCARRVAIEAGVSMGWHKYTGLAGLVIGMDRFGASAPYKVLAEKFGFNQQAVMEMIKCTYPELF